MSTDVTFEKIELTELATGGNAAPPATATNPAMSAYSMRSWPLSSLQNECPVNWLQMDGMGCSLPNFNPAASSRSAQWRDYLKNWLKNLLGKPGDLPHEDAA